MGRPVKRRRVCGLPKTSIYGPVGVYDEDETVNLSVDEYETIRLIDLEGLTQAECAEQMNVARTTVQGIYSEARKKIAESIVNGKLLNIDGGHYKLCKGRGSRCRMGSCKEQ